MSDKHNQEEEFKVQIIDIITTFSDMRQMFLWCLIQVVTHINS